MHTPAGAAGRPDPANVKAWRMLADKVLVDNAMGIRGHGIILEAIPKIRPYTRWANPTIPYEQADLVAALAEMLKADPACAASDGYRFDVVNLTRQVLGNHAATVHARMMRAYEEKDLAAFRAAAERFLEIGRDLDMLSARATNSCWDAGWPTLRSWAANPAEHVLRAQRPADHHHVAQAGRRVERLRSPPVERPATHLLLAALAGVHCPARQVVGRQSAAGCRELRPLAGRVRSGNGSNRPRRNSPSIPTAIRQPLPGGCTKNTGWRNCRSECDDENQNPRFRLLLVLCFLVAANGLLPKAAGAETRTAAALTPEAVWEAIDAAKDGDTVQLPAGTAAWSKGWNTGHGAKMKAITIQGAGIDKTVIRDRSSAGPRRRAFRVAGSGRKAVPDHGHYLRRNGLRPTPGVWAGEIVIGGNCKNFRIDHCKFMNADRMMTINGDTYRLDRPLLLSRHEVARRLRCRPSVSGTRRRRTTASR